MRATRRSVHAKALLGVLVLTWTAAGAWAVPAITVGSLEAFPNEIRTFDIQVTGGDMVQGLDFYVQIGDGGVANGGADTVPVITAVDIVGAGTLFSASNTGQRTPLSSDLLWAVSTTTDIGQAATLAASGICARLTVDTTGTAIGESFPLLLTGVAEGIFGAPGVDTAFAGLAAQITNGTINIVVRPGDATGDGFVDDTDLAVLLGNWESDPLIISTWELGNFTQDSLGDTDVDDADLAVLLGNWTGPPPPAGAAVPEPATLAILALGGLTLARKRGIEPRE